MPTPAESAARMVAARRAQKNALAPVKTEARAEWLRLCDEARALKKGAVFQAKERALVSGHANDLFPTPPNLADELVGDCQIEPSSVVVEPSAGTGRIAIALRNAGHNPICLELSYSAAELLRQQGFEVECRDFLEWQGSARYFVMNPPFSNGQDIAHVRHAYDCLENGGRMVSVMGEGAFFRQDKHATAFRQWLEDVGGISERLPDATFKASGTNVATRKVIISK